MRRSLGGGCDREPVPQALTVLLVHNRYREAGGEEQVFEAEGRLLESLGHRVVRLEVDNARVAELGTLRLGARTIWSVESHRELTRLARDVRPDVAHVHNTLPLLSPAVHHALAATGSAVVQTLHNYRLLCPQGMLLRNGRPCSACVGRTPPWPAVLHACYRGSRSATAAVAGMLTVHRGLRTWSRKVDAFIALSEFAKARFVEGGLAPERLHLKPNFVHPDPGPGPGNRAEGFFLYVGRLTAEKGIPALLEAWRTVTARGAPDGGTTQRLVIVGDGPLAPQVREAAQALPSLTWLGRQPRERVLEEMGRARALVFPSLCYENSPGVILEAFARALPVLGSRLGSTAELVRDGVTGRTFSVGDSEDLARTLLWASSADVRLERLAEGARSAFEGSHTAEVNAARLLEIYAVARAVRASRSQPAP